MRDAPRHVAPRRHPLGADQVGHIVEGDHIALQVTVVATPGRHAHQQIFKAALPGHLHLGLGDLARAVRHRFEQGAELRHGDRNRQRLLVLVPVEQPHG